MSEDQILTKLTTLHLLTYEFVGGADGEGGWERFNNVVVREEALFVLTCRAFPILRLADLTLETALPIDTSFK